MRAYTYKITGEEGNELILIARQSWLGIITGHMSVTMEHREEDGSRKQCGCVSMPSGDMLDLTFEGDKA